MSVMRISDLLAQAWGLVDKNKTKHTFAKDAEGNSVDATSDKAVCFCSLGAAYRVAASVTEGESYFETRNKMDQSLSKAARTLFRHDIMDVNDNRSHDDLKKVFDLAIETARKEEGVCIVS